MKKDFLQATRKKAYLVICLQVIMVLLIAILYFFFKGKNYFLSAIAGGVSWLLPSFYFTRKLFIMPDNKSALKMVKNFYVAEIFKLVLSGVLIVISFKFLHVEVISFLVAYIGAVFSVWLFPIIL